MWGVLRGPRRRAAALLACGFVAAALLALQPLPASAHATETKTVPAAGSLLPTSPSRVDVWFSERVVPGLSSLAVYDGTRRRVDLGNSTVDTADPYHLTVGLPTVPPGLYTVVWSNLSADDGHPEKGGFAFTVLAVAPSAAGVATGAAPGSPVQGWKIHPHGPVRGEAGTVRQWASTDGFFDTQSADLLDVEGDRRAAAFDVLSGWLTISALLLAGGGAAFSLVCLRPALAGGPTAAAFRQRLDRRFSLVSLCCAGAGAGAAFVSLLAKGELVTGLPPGRLLSPAIVGAILQPLSGRVWSARELAFAALAAVAARSLHRTPTRPPALVATMLLAAAGLLCTALDSHLAAGHVTRPGPLAAPAAMLHLLAVDIWVGGLVYAAVVLGPARRWAPDELRPALTTAIDRFSPLALAGVVLIVLTGAYAAFLLIPAPSDLLWSAYGQALDAKIALLIVLMLFGVANRRALARLAPAGGGSTTDLVDRMGSRLMRAMRLECAIAAVVVLAAGVMLEVGPPGQGLPASAVKLAATGTMPASPSALAAAPPPKFVGSARAGEVALDLSAEPALAGATSALAVQLSDGGPVEHAEVKLRLTAQGLNLGTQVLTALPEAPGRYGVVAPAFAAPGTWQVQVVVRRDGQPEVQGSFAVPVQAPALGAGGGAIRGTLIWSAPPVTVGYEEARLHLVDEAARPLAAARVQGTWLMPQQAYTSRSTFSAFPESAGTYSSRVDLGIAGAWQAELVITLSDGRSARLQYAFNVRGRGLIALFDRVR